MLTRILYLSAGWFVISLLATLLAGNHLKKNHVVISEAWLVSVILIGGFWELYTFGVPVEIASFSALAFLFAQIWIFRLKDWNALGQVTWSMTLLVTGVFIVYAFNVTAFSPLNPISFLIAITFLFIEALALLLALTHTYESLDVTCRTRWHRRIDQFKQISDYQPMVSLHLPTYNEPLEVVEQTLNWLSKLDYPNYEVLVVDNNTPDDETWRPLEKICEELGPNFHLLHLDQWPGYKSGALNFALTQTNADAEIIGTIDADYQLDPGFLRALVPGFVDPEVAFIQTPQDYRDYEGDSYTEATYYGYKYFFEVSMPSRNEHNAIIFAGTMGLIRRSVLEEIGGWDEWCITEDAEASLRILKRGYRSMYLKKTFGRGLMPFNFEGLKKQRFRWCFGGIQILKKHWEALMPWAHWVDPKNKLTFQQRYYYLVGGLQWFTDLFNLLFVFFLVMGAVFSMVHTSLQIRPLTRAIMLMPALFLVLNLWRFVWVLRSKLKISIGMAFKTMFNFFSMGWAVTLASIQGLVQPEGVFLRTPKAKSGSRALKAIRVTQWETLIGLACITSGILAFVIHPQVRTFFLGGLLTWQASLYLAAPLYSLLSARTDQTEFQEVETGRPIMEHWAARWALGIAIVIVVAVGAYSLLPGPSKPPSYTRYQPPQVPPGQLFNFNKIPVYKPPQSPTPTATRKPTATPTPEITPTATEEGNPGFLPSPSPTATLTSLPTSEATITSTATITGTSTATLTPPPRGTLTVTPTVTLTPPPSGTATVTPTATLTATLIAEPTPTPLTTATLPPQLTPTPIASQTPGPTGTATLPPLLTPTPTALTTLQPTTTTTILPVFTPTAQPQPSPTPTLGFSPRPTLSPTPVPNPTSTPPVGSTAFLWPRRLAH